MSVYWRFKTATPTAFSYGWMTRLENGLLRMGSFHGDTMLGPIVKESEVEIYAKNC